MTQTALPFPARCASRLLAGRIFSCGLGRRRAAPVRTILFATVAAVVVLLPLVPLGAQAQTQNEFRAVVERMNRLESDLTQLQARVYRGGGAPPTSGAVSSGGGDASSIYAQLSTRLDQFDETVRSLTGRVEELGHKVDESNARLEKFMADSDFRFKELEKGGGSAAGGAAAAASSPASAPTPPASSTATAPSSAGAAAESDDLGPSRSPPPRTLGKLSTGTPPPNAGASAGAGSAAGAEAVKLPGGSAQDQYNYATHFLRKSEYPEAEQALEAFLKAHADDPLAPAAQYWLGETFFVRNQYDKAASAFLTGYQKYPKSNKAPDNLLKLGMSLTSLNQKQEACATFTQLASQFPHAEARIKQNLARERGRAGCQ